MVHFNISLGLLTGFVLPVDIPERRGVRRPLPPPQVRLRVASRQHRRRRRPLQRGRAVLGAQRRRRPLIAVGGAPGVGVGVGVAPAEPVVDRAGQTRAAEGARGRRVLVPAGVERVPDVRHYYLGEFLPLTHLFNLSTSHLSSNDSQNDKSRTGKKNELLRFLCSSKHNSAI